MHTFTSDIESVSRALAQSCLDRLALEAPLDHTRTPGELRDAAGETITPSGMGGEEAPPGPGCPQLHPPAATGQATKVSHLRSNQQRLTAHSTALEF